MAPQEFPFLSENLLGLKLGTMIPLTLEEICRVGAELRKTWGEEGIEWRPGFQKIAGNSGPGVYNRRIVVPRHQLKAFDKGGPFHAIVKRRGLDKVFATSEAYGDLVSVATSPHLTFAAMAMAFVFGRVVHSAAAEGRVPVITYHFPYGSAPWASDGCPLPMWMVSNVSMSGLSSAQKGAALLAVHEALSAAKPKLKAATEAERMTEMLRAIDGLDVMLPSGDAVDAPTIKIVFGRPPRGRIATAFASFFATVSDKGSPSDGRRAKAENPTSQHCSVWRVRRSRS